MIITPIKTDKLIPEKDNDIFEVLDKSLPEKINDSSVIAITSKIISITEGNVIKMDQTSKDELIEKESQFYLERNKNPYNVSLTITQNNLSASAGIDESNGNGYYILWPKDPYSSANRIRAYLKNKYSLKHIGVIITDSKTTPLRWGVTGISIAYSGFKPLFDYTGKPDLFGRTFQYEKLSIIDSLASSAVLVMGEGAEQTPIALIEDLPFLEFQDRDTTEEELAMLRIEVEKDIYAPFLKNAEWKKGLK